MFPQATFINNWMREILIIAGLIAFIANARPANSDIILDTTSCFTVPSDPSSTMGKKVLNVGKEMSVTPDQLCIFFQFCGPCHNSPRIIFVLDNSGSMCQEVTSCAGASNNDPTNIRVAGANALVDSMAKRCSDCEIGVIVFTGVGNDSTGARTVTQVVEPIPLNSIVNLDRIHSAINAAACRGGGIGKNQSINKLAKKTLTFTGIALDSAIKLVDADFNTLSGIERHIILFTDGDWQKPTPNDLIAAYKLNYPGRLLPIIHGVIISDTATHIAAGFPPFGCLSCNDIDTVPVDFSFLQQVSKAAISPGIFIHGTTPESIVGYFDTLFQVINDISVVYLASVTFINANTSEQRIAAFKPDTADNSGRRFIISIPPFNLEFGANTFLVKIDIPGCCTGLRATIIDTLVINRSTEEGTLTRTLFLPGPHDQTIKLFDISGRLIKTFVKKSSSSNKKNFHGVYFLKYSNGKVKRRVAVFREDRDF